MPTSSLDEKERIEIDAWRRGEMESGDSIDNLANKLTDAQVFLQNIGPFRPLFARASTILELGAGEGWASCLVQKLHPGASVMASDISPYAIRGLRIWERVHAVRLPRAFACRSYAVPLASASVDLVFAFAAAHHFRAHRRTLAEVARILRPGGACLFLHEPASPKYLYPLAYIRVNRKRPDVPEDVLVLEQLENLAASVGLTATFVFDLSTTKRGPIELLYYSLLNALPPLKHVLPCTRHLLFERPLESAGR